MTDGTAGTLRVTVWGENRHEQIRLFAERVLPHFR